MGWLVMQPVGAEEMWDLFSDWHPTGNSPAGDAHYIARDSIMKAPQSNDMFSFYIKVLFKTPQHEEGLFFDEEIADMVIDCSSGRMDTLSAARYFQGILAGKQRFHSERSKRVKVDTLAETELRLICGKNLPLYIQQKGQPRVRSSRPWR